MPPVKGSKKVKETIDNAVQEVVAVVNTININKKVFWTVLVLFVIGLCMALYFINRSQQYLDYRIQKDVQVIKDMSDSVKLRDQQILANEKNIKAKDLIIADYEDSIEKAYSVLDKLQHTKNTQYKAHEKDSISISNLSIRGKMQFITGKH